MKAYSLFVIVLSIIFQKTNYNGFYLIALVGYPLILVNLKIDQVRFFTIIIIIVILCFIIIDENLSSDTVC